MSRSSFRLVDGDYAGVSPRLSLHLSAFAIAWFHFRLFHSSTLVSIVLCCMYPLKGFCHMEYPDSYPPPLHGDISISPVQMKFPPESG